MPRKAKLPIGFDDNPEWTKGDFSRARPASDVVGEAAAAALTRPRGRPALPADQRKQAVSIRLSPDVLAALKAAGEGWQTRAEQILRAALIPTSPVAIASPKEFVELQSRLLREYFDRAAAEEGGDGSVEVANDPQAELTKDSSKKRA